MSAWLDPVRRALAANTSPVAFFVRDDDVGWEDDELHRLLDVVIRFQVPTALAAIPAALGSRLASDLRTLVTARAPMLSVHQHGFAHVNHEPAGRKSEFGASRPRAVQRQEIADGRDRLQHLLGVALPPIFTPPWNRCTRDTGECLVELGFQILSRDITAEPIAVARLRELPVCLDWTGRRGARMGAARWGETIARAIVLHAPIGVLLHHAVMTADDRRMFSELLQVLTEHSNAVVPPMLDIAAASHVSGGISSCAS